MPWVGGCQPVCRCGFSGFSLWVQFPCTPPTKSSEPRVLFGVFKHARSDGQGLGGSIQTCSTQLACMHSCAKVLHGVASEIRTSQGFCLKGMSPHTLLVNSRPVAH